MQSSSSLQLDPESVRNQTRYLATLSRVARILGVILFALSVLYAVASIGGGRPAPGPAGSILGLFLAPVVVILGGMFQAAMCFLVAAILDSLRMTAVNSARAAAAAG